MKTMLSVLAASLLLALTGCNTLNHRIHEKAAVYYALDAATQDQIRQGQVGIGYTPDMVYIALGEPTRRVSHLASDGSHDTWIYKSYYEEYAGTAFAGYHRYAVPGRLPGRYTVYTEPVYTDLYRQRSQEYLRISFKDGKVASIDQTRDT
jgi:hypothetical protein